MAEDIHENLKNQYNPDGSDLRKAQLRMLRILKTVTDICDKYDIQYWLGSGTLLGAKRHGGFIPWDDDVDVELLREDYQRLIELLPEELPDDMYLQTPNEGGGYRLLFSKVRDRNSVLHTDEEKVASYKEKGLYIDLFVEERGYWWSRGIINFFYGRGARKLKRGRPFHSIRYFMSYITAALIWYPVGLFLLWLARLFAKWTKPPYIMHSYGITATAMHHKDDMFPTSKIEFEGELFSAPKNIDAFLTAAYGNYMQIPAEEKRQVNPQKVSFL